MARTSTMLLLTGDYADRLDALYARAQNVDNRAREAASKAEQTPGPRRMGETSAHAELRAEAERLEAEYAELKAEAEAEGVRIVLQAIGRKEWRDLKAKHPPRVTDVDEDTQKADRLAGVNTDAIEDDLVFASLVEPSFSTRADYDAWANGITEGDFQAILTRAWGLVNVPRYDPKSLPGSATPNNGSNSQSRVSGG